MRWPIVGHIPDGTITIRQNILNGQLLPTFKLIQSQPLTLPGLLRTRYTQDLILHPDTVVSVPGYEINRIGPRRTFNLIGKVMDHWTVRSRIGNVSVTRFLGNKPKVAVWFNGEIVASRVQQFIIPRKRMP